MARLLRAAGRLLSRTGFGEVGNAESHDGVGVSADARAELVSRPGEPIE